MMNKYVKRAGLFIITPLVVFATISLYWADILAGNEDANATCIFKDIWDGIKNWKRKEKWP
ncbi:MAG: hypothetical protein Q7S51_10245 [Gallionellaceae bacterium]|nr:hypothetical protein [Gallionellaceae bacterium]